MRLIINKISSIFHSKQYIHASNADLKNVPIGQKKTLDLLEKYDKGQVEINYTTELKKLEKFARSSS